MKVAFPKINYTSIIIANFEQKKSCFCGFWFAMSTLQARHFVENVRDNLKKIKPIANKSFENPMSPTFFTNLEHPSDVVRKNQVE